MQCVSFADALYIFKEMWRMKKTMKKILCTVLVVVMCMTSAPLQGFVGFDLKAEAVADYKVGDIIQFGSYPQSEVKDEAVIEKLNSLAPADRKSVV